MRQHPLTVTDDDFDLTVLRSEFPVVVDFWAPWCGPCQWLSPILEDLAQEYAGQIVFVKVDTDQHGRYTTQFGVQGIPTLILFDNGIEVDRLVGAQPKAALRQWLDTAVRQPALVS